MNSRVKTKSFTLPKIFSALLQGGLKVYSIPKPELPLVSIHLVLPRGAEADPPGKAGLADLTAEMLTLGTQKRSASRLAAEVDGLGATLSAQSGWDSTSLHLFGLSEDFERLMSLLLEIYTQPAFPPEEFEQLKQRRIANLVQEKDESEIIADERFQEILFQGTPYDHPAYGTLKTIPQLVGDEAKEFYQRGFLPEGSFLLMIGDVEEEACFRWVEAHFPGGVRGKEAVSKTPSFYSPSGVKTVMIDRPDLTQSQIRLGHIGMPHGHPDFLPFEVMNFVLGAGGFSSRLMTKIRVERGYTYGIRGSLALRKNPGPYSISTFTPTATTFPCVREIFSLIQSFLVQGATEREREEAINFLTGSYPLKFESLPQIAQRIIQAEVHGLGLESLADYPERIAAVTLEEMALSARKHLHPERMLIVIVGRSEKFRGEFEPLGPVAIRE